MCRQIPQYQGLVKNMYQTNLQNAIKNCLLNENFPFQLLMKWMMYMGIEASSEKWASVQIGCIYTMILYVVVATMARNEVTSQLAQKHASLARDWPSQCDVHVRSTDMKYDQMFLVVILLMWLMWLHVLSWLWSHNCDIGYKQIMPAHTEEYSHLSNQSCLPLLLCLPLCSSPLDLDSTAKSQIRMKHCYILDGVLEKLF